jgi:hypothetical protein
VISSPGKLQKVGSGPANCSWVLEAPFHLWALFNEGQRFHAPTTIEKILPKPFYQPWNACQDMPTFHFKSMRAGFGPGILITFGQSVQIQCCEKGKFLRSYAEERLAKGVVSEYDVAMKRKVLDHSLRIK